MLLRSCNACHVVRLVIGLCCPHCSYTEAWKGRPLPDEHAGAEAATPSALPATSGTAPASPARAGPGTASEQPTSSTDGTPAPQQSAGSMQTLPRVFYATRTHSQIAQVHWHVMSAAGRSCTWAHAHLILPLAHRSSGSSSALGISRAWPYWWEQRCRIVAVLRWHVSNTMAQWLQASRTHYCCHPSVSKKKNVDEECDKLMEDSACKYFTNVQKLYGMQTSTVLQVLLPPRSPASWRLLSRC